MKPSKYLNRFQNMSARYKEDYQLIGDCILVEKIPQEERKTQAGIIVRAGMNERAKDTMSTDVPSFYYVLAVGEGYYKEDTQESVPLNVKPGDIILVGNHSVRLFSDLDIQDYQSYDIGITRETEATLIFRGQEAYSRVFGALNPTIEQQVQAGILVIASPQATNHTVSHWPSHSLREY